MDELEINLNKILTEKETKILPENIKSGITIFNVAGTLEAGTDTTDSTATADDIIAPKTAYVNGEKITGNIEREIEYVSADLKAYNVENLDTQLTSKRDNCLVTYNFTNKTIDVYKINSYIEQTTNLELMDSYDISDLCSMDAKWDSPALDIGIEDSDGNRYGVLIKKDVSSTSNYAIIFKIYNYKIIGIKELNVGNLTDSLTIYASMVTFANTHSNLFALYIASNATAYNRGIIVCAEINPDLTIYSYGTTDIGATNMNACSYLSSHFRYMKFANDDVGFVVMGSAYNYRVQTLSKITYANNHLSSIKSIYRYVYYGKEPTMYNDDFTYSITASGLFKNIIDWNNNSFTEHSEQICSFENTNCIPVWFHSNLILLRDKSANTLKLYNVDVLTGSIEFILELTVDCRNSSSWYFDSIKVNYNDVIYYYNKVQIVQIGAEEIKINNLKAHGTTYYNTLDSNVLASDIIEGKIGYNVNGKVIGTMPNNGELNYIPHGETLTIPAGYTSGGTIAGDSNLLPENIKAGVTIFGVTGTYEGSGESSIYEEMSYLQLTTNSSMILGITIDTSYTYKMMYEDSTVEGWEAYIGSIASSIYLARNNNGSGFSKSYTSNTLSSIPTVASEDTIKFSSGQGEGIVLGTTSGSTAPNAAYKLYHLKIFDNSGTLVNHLVPVKNTTDESVGLLDKVTNRFIQYDG